MPSVFLWTTYGVMYRVPLVLRSSNAIHFTPLFFVNFPHKSNFLEFYFIRFFLVSFGTLDFQVLPLNRKDIQRNHRKETLKWYVVSVKYIAICIVGVVYTYIVDLGILYFAKNPSFFWITTSTISPVTLLEM